MQTFKFRLAPSTAQRTKLLQTLELCRWTYNETLATRKQAWEREQKSITRFDTIKLLPSWKARKPELAQVHSQVLQEVCTRVELAFQAYFRRVQEHAEKVGYPRFKGYGRYDSFTYPQTGFELLAKGLRLSKIGAIQIIQHRPIAGRIKTLNLQRDAVGNWYACCACEVEPPPWPCNALAVGIDVGLTPFATLSHGVTVDNPRFFRRAEVELGRAQRRDAKDKTPQRRKVIAHIQQRIANRRKDFVHKLSRELVNTYGALCLENLAIKNMLQNHQLAKSIGDAAWRQLIQSTHYKAEWAGSVCELVDPRGTSQRCSGCGAVVQKDLAVRVHACPWCGLVLDRDLNAAINIESIGLDALGFAPELMSSGVAVEAPVCRRGGVVTENKRNSKRKLIFKKIHKTETQRRGRCFIG
jgi:putative transposase